MGHYPEAPNSSQTVFQSLISSSKLLSMGFHEKFFLISLMILLGPWPWVCHANTLGVLGDSLSTGAAAHPALKLDTHLLWEVFEKPENIRASAEHYYQDLPWIALLNDQSTPGATAQKTPIPPQKAWPTVRELYHGIDFTGLTFINAISQSFLNTEEYSWSYQLAPALSIKPDRVIMAAENGAKIGSINRQIDRMVNANRGVVPEMVFIFFTGNDICGPTPDYMTPAKAFADELTAGLTYLARQKKPAAGVKVYVLSYLNITQISTRPQILDKNLEAYGTRTTCRTLHSQSFKPTTDQLKTMHEKFLSKVLTTQEAGESSKQPAWWPWVFLQLMPPSPADMCPNLFGFGENATLREEHLSLVANRVREYRQFSEKAILAFNDSLSTKDQKLQVIWLSHLQDLLFDADDIAHDCFHLSARGQGKLALKIFENIPKEN